MKVRSGFAFVGSVLAVLAVTLSAKAADDDFPIWAYPKPPARIPADATVIEQVPGSPLHLTQAQIVSDFDPPDWFPNTHPPMPQVVGHGRQPAVRPCAQCHLPTGAGHPESADLAGLPVGYLKDQMAAFKDGSRHGASATPMIPIAHAITDAEIAAAAQYYVGLPDPVWTKVIETQMVAKSYLYQDSLRLADPNGGEEPMGERIIQLPEDPKSAVLRALTAGFFAYVPVGSVAKGKELVETGGQGKTIACSTCHGENLLGVDDIPHISGRSPLYVFRQLNDFKTGRRADPNAAPMKQVAANLSRDDMISIAAYLGTLTP